MGKLRLFDSASLAAFDGKNGNSAYVAYKGLVYDVSFSWLWEAGAHGEDGKKHQAGRDLTGALSGAPHGEELIRLFPIVGFMVPVIRSESMNAIELLELAIEAERRAQQQYREGAAQADDAETRMLFEQLTHWEESHEALLRERLTTLRLLRSETQ